MMKGQARRSGLVMGLDTHMIAGRRACSRPARPTQPNITNRSNPHYDETLHRVPIVRVGSGSGGRGGGVVAVGATPWLDFLARFPCRAAQEVSVPDGSTPVGEVVIVA